LFLSFSHNLSSRTPQYLWSSATMGYSMRSSPMMCMRVRFLRSTRPTLRKPSFTIPSIKHFNNRSCCHSALSSRTSNSPCKVVSLWYPTDHPRGCLSSPRAFPSRDPLTRQGDLINNFKGAIITQIIRTACNVLEVGAHHKIS
jgi:hypothetical protein